MNYELGIMRTLPSDLRSATFPFRDGKIRVHLWCYYRVQGEFAVKVRGGSIKSLCDLRLRMQAGRTAFGYGAAASTARLALYVKSIENPLNPIEFSAL